MIDDFILYTVLNDLCKENEVKFALNVLEKCAEILVKSMPLLISEPAENQKAIQHLWKGIFDNWQMNKLDIYSISLEVKDSRIQDPEWQYLYPTADFSNNVTPLILNACI